MKTLLRTSENIPLLSAVLMSLVMSPFAIAEETNGEFPMCQRYSDLKEIWQAISNGDDRQVEALLKDNNCIIPKKGIKLSVISRIGAIDKVRVYTKDDSFVFYTSKIGYD